jgi:hypothetical protein
MSDEEYTCDPGYCQSLELYDHIKALTAERNEAWRRAGHAEEQWGRCEVNLAKAVEGLREIAGFAEKEWVTPSGEAPPDVQNLCDIARATLAEIEEEMG